MMLINEKTTIQFSDEFFNEEERCGFVVTSSRKKIWAIELDLLDQLLRVCFKYDIKVSVFAGTLLGAVRHKGFIPWDDDVDVCLTRPEYEKLISVAPHEFKNQYFLQTALSDRKFFLGYARLRNSLTTGIITGQETPYYNNGIYIDVFVLDGIIDNEVLLKSQLKKRTFYNWLLGCYLGYKSRRLLARLGKRIIQQTYCKYISYEKEVERYNANLNKYTMNTDKVGLMTHSYSFIKKYWCYKDDINDLTLVPFEGLNVPVPCNYDQVLKNMYGDYLSYPPVEQRGEWHKGEIYFNPEVPYLDFLTDQNGV